MQPFKLVWMDVGDDVRQDEDEFHDIPVAIERDPLLSCPSVAKDVVHFVQVCIDDAYEREIKPQCVARQL